MRRLLPHPLVTLALILAWLLLTRFSLGQLVLGTAVSTLAGWALGRLGPPRPTLRRWSAVPHLLGTVAADILRSNAAVAWLIATRGRGGSRVSGFLRVRLRLRHPAALATLGVIVTATPGTAWIEFDDETGILVLHVFDLVDEAEWRALIQDRYETLLMEIFE